MKLFIAALAILGLITGLNGCKNASIPSNDFSKTEPDAAEPDNFHAFGIRADHHGDTFSLTGTTVYKDFEGGFFAIDGDDGKKYNPIHLSEAYRKDGLKVKVSARYADAMGIHMYGAMIDIVEIEIAAK